MATTLTTARPHRRRLRQRTRHIINGLLFASPWLIGLLVFWIYPTLASAYYSFTKFNAVQAPRWVGLANYIELFTQDINFKAAVFNTFYFAVVSIPLARSGIHLALMLNAEPKGRSCIGRRISC